MLKCLFIPLLCIFINSAFAQLTLTCYSTFAVGVETKLYKKINGEFRIFTNNILDEADAEIQLFYGFNARKYHQIRIGLGLNGELFNLEGNAFLVTMSNIGLKVLLAISVAGMVGVNTAAFVGVLAAAGLAVGLALQGSLSNFAAGILIVPFKPYKIDDWIEVNDKFGKVKSIQIFNTIVNTPGNKTLIIPNGQVISGIITNFSTIGNIRIELKVPLPYTEDFPKVKALIMEELATIPKILNVPEPEIGIEEFGQPNLVISVRPYVLPSDYLEVYYEVMSKIKHTMYHNNNIKMAYQEGLMLEEVGK